MEAVKTELEQALQGYELESKCIDPGDYKTPSQWTITVKRNGHFYTTVYSQGCSYRRWKKKHGFGSPSNKDRKLKPYHTTGPLSSFREEQLIDWTEPTEPKLKDVMYCLVSEAGCVMYGQSFEDFAADLGWDTGSRKAYKAFEGCTNAWRALVRMGADLEKLTEAFRDY